MEKRILQTYSVWAKENLEKQVEVSLKTLGINGDKDIKKAKQIGDYTIIDGDPNSYPTDLLSKRNQIVTLITEEGYKYVIEEFAYTWFNRFVALRFMEVHDFLSHGFRVLSNRNGGVEPEIFKNLSFVKTELHLDMDICASLKEQGKTEELFRYVLLHQCSSLADILPMLFAKDNDYLELLLPKSLLIGETVITRLIEIPEEAFLDDVEVIGWLYQFYVADKRHEYRDAKILTKELIPTLTQVFTTDWIVRYMAENSVGRIWMESYPQSTLHSKMRYYVDDPEQTEDVQRKLDAIKYKNVNPEEIRVIEPCCGSGHILVYVFDLLYKMYEEKGYQKRDIPSLILAKNLYGLEIDKRATQLAAFSLVMKARNINPRFFDDTYYIEPQVYEIFDSHLLESLGYKQRMTETAAFTNEEIKAVETLVETFRNGKTVGSLIKVKPMKYELINGVIHKLEHSVVTNIFNISFATEGKELLKRLLAQATVMASKYDVMITNPPYLGITKMESMPKEYLTVNYPDSKSDMFAMFMEAPLVKANGFKAIVNPDSWMFLVSFQKQRANLLKTQTIVNMVHLGMGAFDAVVQTTAFIMRQSYLNFKAKYYRQVNENEKEMSFLARNNEYIPEQDNFYNIPDNPIAYWATPAAYKSFVEFKPVSDYAPVVSGMTTGNNDKYMRDWKEININTIAFNKCKVEDVNLAKQYWFPYNKGGAFRRWYGNNDFVVNWSKSGEFNRAKTTMTYLYLKKCITWSDITSAVFSARACGHGFFFDVQGSCAFPDEGTYLPLIALLNSKVTMMFIKMLNPTIHTQVGDLQRIPMSPKVFGIEVKSMAQQCIDIARDDYDSTELSWDFKAHPLIRLNHPLASIFEEWNQTCLNRFNGLKKIEQELNQKIIDIYQLHNELTAEIGDKYISVHIADKETDIKSLLSYLIGVVMGRYSLDMNGVTYAGGEWNASKYLTYQPDDDGILPIYTQIGMADGLTTRIIELIKQVYGADTYRQNIDFIAEALGKSNNESSEETLNRYLNDGFYADHLRIYQKRPIYWMFSSGKFSGFKCLIYMHRYTEDTLARINGKYFLPESTRLKNDMEELLSRINAAEVREKIRLEKERQKLSSACNEAIEYGQVLDHMANKYITINLDDGVKVNYAKFQDVELVTDSGAKVKKDLLVPIK